MALPAMHGHLQDLLHNVGSLKVVGMVLGYICFSQGVETLQVVLERLDVLRGVGDQTVKDVLVRKVVYKL